MAVLNLDAEIAHVKRLRDHLARTNANAQTWDAAGIRAALAQADGAPWEISAAASLMAGDASCRTPSPAALRNHWPVNAGPAPEFSRRTSMCPVHGETMRPLTPDGPDRCQQCATQPQPRPETIAAAKAAAKAAGTGHARPRPPAVDTARDPDHLDQARAQIGDPA